MERLRAWANSNPVTRFIKVAILIFVNQYVIGLAQQIAFNILFSVAPLLIFLTACVSLLANYLNRDVENPAQPIIDWINENVPADVASVLDDPVRSALGTDASLLLSVGGVLSLWAAKNAIAATMRGLNATYGIREVRPFLAHNAVAIALTIGMIGSAFTISLLQFLGTHLGAEVASIVGLDATWSRFVEDVQTPITMVVLIFALVALHRFGPTFRGPFRWYLPGAVFTMLGVVVATWAFQKYFEFSTEFSAYGAFGAMLALMLWLFIISLVILIGGIINAALFETFTPAKQALARFRADHPEEKHTLDQLREEVKDAVP